MSIQTNDEVDGKKECAKHIEDVNFKLELFTARQKVENGYSNQSEPLRKASENPRTRLGFLPEFLRISLGDFASEVLDNSRRWFGKRDAIENRLEVSFKEGQGFVFYALPNIDYTFQEGQDCLRFSADVCGAVSFTIYAKEFAEDFIHGSWSTKIEWEKKELVPANHYFFLKSTRFPKLTLPLRLVKGLTDGVRIVDLVPISDTSKDFVICNIEKFSKPLVLPVSFRDYLVSWKLRGGFRVFLEQYLQNGATNSVTVEIIGGKLSQAKAQEPPASVSSVNSSINASVNTVNATVSAPVNAVVNTNRLSSSDLRRLKQGFENPGPFTYSKWALLLQFDTGAPQSAFAWLHRMEREGFIKLIKSQDGVTVSAKHVALEALKLFHVTPS